MEISRHLTSKVIKSLYDRKAWKELFDQVSNVSPGSKWSNGSFSEMLLNTSSKICSRVDLGLPESTYKFLLYLPPGRYTIKGKKFYYNGVISSEINYSGGVLYILGDGLFRIIAEETTPDFISKFPQLPLESTHSNSKAFFFLMSQLGVNYIIEDKSSSKVLVSRSSSTFNILDKNHVYFHSLSDLADVKLSREQSGEIFNLIPYSIDLLGNVTYAPFSRVLKYGNKVLTVTDLDTTSLPHIDGFVFSQYVDDLEQTNKIIFKGTSVNERKLIDAWRPISYKNVEFVYE